MLLWFHSHPELQQLYRQAVLTGFLDEQRDRQAPLDLSRGPSLQASRETKHSSSSKAKQVKSQEEETKPTRCTSTWSLLGTLEPNALLISCAL